MFEPIDSAAADDQFRITDGERWYDMNSIGDEDLDEDAPPGPRLRTGRAGMNGQALDHTGLVRIDLRDVSVILRAG
jgi:hypothetical protein